MVTKVCPTTERLRSYADGTLLDKECEVLFGHLEKCSKCLSELQRLDHMSNDPLVEILKAGADVPFGSEPQCLVAIRKAQSLLKGDTEQRELVDPLAITKVGDYEVLRLLGQGGMGSVYLANHEKLGRKVALKVLARHRLLDPRMRERFALEMRAVGGLSHPNIVTAFDAREIDGTTVLVTEYIDGLDLGKVLNRLGSLSTADACQIALIVAQVLAYTEQRGFVHRDIKPSNIMLSSQGTVKVLDLGLARIASLGSEHAELTLTGQALGSPDYAAPEQIQDSRAVDARSDIYSLGCTLFKMLSGRHVFEGEGLATPFAKMTAHVCTTPPSLGSVVTAVDRRVVQLVDSMLQKDPNKRPQSATELVQVLQAFIGGSDLASLIERALRTPDLPVPTPIAHAIPATSQLTTTQADMMRRVPISVAIGGGLFGILMGLFLGIVITITNRDGTQTKITVPDGSPIEIDAGNSAASVAATAIPSSAPQPSIDVAAAVKPTGFLVDNTPAALPTLKNVVVFSSNKPGKITQTQVDAPVVRPGEAYVSDAEMSSRVSHVILLDSRSMTVAVSVSANPSYGAENKQRSKVFVGPLPAGPLKEVVSTELQFTLLDHDIRTGQSLGVAGEKSRPGDRELVLFEGLLEGEPRELSRRPLPVNREQTINVTQGKLVGPNRALVVLSGVAYCWDLKDGTQVYQTDVRRPHLSRISFSADRTLMSLVDTHGVHLADTKTGADLGFIRFETRLQPSIAPFDRYSQRIALCSEDAWSTYDLETMTLQKEQTATWSLGGRLSGWIAPDLLLAENGVIIHTGRQVPVWKLYSNSLVVSERQSEVTFWADTFSFVDRDRGVRIRTLPMPPQELKSTLASMPPAEDMMLTGPGTKVRLELELPDPLPQGVDADLIKSKMTEIIARSEWKVDEQESHLKLVCKIAPGKKYTAQHLEFEKPDPASGQHPSTLRPKANTPVEITPLVSTLELRVDDIVVWSFDSRAMQNPGPDYGSPFGKQRTKEEFIEYLQRARPEFFYGVFLPTRIARQPYTHGLGASKELDSSWVESPILP